MKFNVTRIQYLAMLGTVISLTNKEIEIIECMIENDTTDRNIIAEKLNIDVRLISNYKSALVKKKVIKDNVLNNMVKLDKLELNVSNT